MNNHYKKIADEFNNVWKFSDNYKKWAVERIGHILNLNIKDILVDVGGGTGTFSNLIYKEFIPNKVYCIEPEHSMCAIAKKYTNIETICCDTYYFINTLKYNYNKILFKEVIHHIDDRNKLWSNIYNSIGKNGQILIYTRPKEIRFPLFEKAKRAFYKNQPSEEMIVSELNNNGFKTKIFIESFTFKLSKKEWHAMIKAKFMSDLSIFSEQELIKGIEEVESKYCVNNFYYIEDKIIFINAYK